MIDYGKYATPEARAYVAERARVVAAEHPRMVVHEIAVMLRDAYAEMLADDAMIGARPDAEWAARYAAANLLVREISDKMRRQARPVRLATLPPRQA